MMPDPLVVRLGRVYVPDVRDWSLPKLHAVLAARASDAMLDMTVREVRDTTSFLSTWDGILRFWRWLKLLLIKPTPAPPSDYPGWSDPIQLDQGPTPHCVGFGWAGWGDSAPVLDTYRDADGHAIYYECKVIDGAPGEENGSAVRSGAKAMQNRGKLVAYAFASSLSEVDEWLNKHGPVVFGTDWYDGMFSPNAQGFVYPTGSVAGGHCYLAIDKLDAEDAYLFVNSWGSSFGLGGRFKMRTADVAKLLSGWGEACCAAEVA